MTVAGGEIPHDGDEARRRTTNPSSCILIFVVGYWIFDGGYLFFVRGYLFAIGFFTLIGTGHA